MSEKSLCEYTITDISPLIKRKDISPVELTTSILDRIHETDHEYNAYISVIRDEAIKLSKQAEKDIMNNDYKGELHGIPLAVKDNIDLVGIPTTNGSKSHEITYLKKMLK